MEQQDWHVREWRLIHGAPAMQHFLVWELWHRLVYDLSRVPVT